MSLHECYLGNISAVNKILSDSLAAASGQKVESMDYYSCNILDFKKDIEKGVVIIFESKNPVKIEFCSQVAESIKKFVNDEKKIENRDIGVGIIYNVRNVYSEERALKMIENYFSLIFEID